MIFVKRAIKRSPVAHKEITFGEEKSYHSEIGIEIFSSQKKFSRIIVLCTAPPSPRKSGLSCFGYTSVPALTIQYRCKFYRLFAPSGPELFLAELFHSKDFLRLR